MAENYTCFSVATQPSLRKRSGGEEDVVELSLSRLSGLSNTFTSSASIGTTGFAGVGASAGDNVGDSVRNLAALLFLGVVIVSDLD